MHILFVDPSEIATRIIPVFVSRRLKVGIVSTKPVDTESIYTNIDKNEVEIIDLTQQSWNKEIKIISAVSWSQAGQEFLESVSSQIALTNINDASMRVSRISNYMNQSVDENSVFIDTFSYKGRHVVMSVWKFINKEWKLFQNFKTAEFIDCIERAWANLDSAGVINGPNQSYLLPNGDIKIKFHPTNAAYGASRGLVTRHWVDIWPTVVEHEEKNPKKSINSFYDWVEKTGSSKQFATQPA